MFLVQNIEKLRERSSQVLVIKKTVNQDFKAGLVLENGKEFFFVQLNNIKWRKIQYIWLNFGNNIMHLCTVGEVDF
jgi:hypothetical protein